MSRRGAGAPGGEGAAGEGAEGAGGTRASARVLVVADDLIWGTRLVGLLRAAGAVPIRARSAAALEAAIASGDVGRAVVDLTARTYDGVAAVGRAAGAGMRVLCVAQHDDAALRRAAMAAGADRVCAYRTLSGAGDTVLATWLGTPAPAPGPGRHHLGAGAGEAPPA